MSRPDSALGLGSSALGPALDAGAQMLAAAAVADARREVVYLWAGLTGTAPGRVAIDRERPVPDDLLARFDGLVRRRAAGEPLAYVLGTAAFRTLELTVTRDTLIPRPETEGLVDHVLRWAEGRAPTALDLGTGSGCIALSLALEGGFHQVVATDVSGAALAVAAANRDALAPDARVEFRQGSLFDPLAPDERFDAIVSNPPYITRQEYDALDASVRDWEPGEALEAGVDGMKQIHGVLDGAARHLAPGGLLAMEVDSRRADRAHAAARARGWSDARIEPDLFGRPRYLIA